MNAMPADIQSAPVAIQVRGLTRRFGAFTAVDHLDFDVRRGEITGFLGPNGAGKTTTIKMIIGLLRPSSGSIVVNGFDAATARAEIKRRTGYMSQKFSLYPLLTGLENIEFFAGISGLRRIQVRSHLERARREINEAALRLKVQDVPPGVRQKIALFVCLMTDPEVILLDEPTSGVDPEVRREFWTGIYRLKKEGRTVMVTTHNLDEAEYADRLLVINRGALILEGEPRELMTRHGADSVETLFKEAIARHETR
jgi:ABC-2 type transport system ATP-binding protein